jgi:hypothetical protein
VSDGPINQGMAAFDRACYKQGVSSLECLSVAGDTRNVLDVGRVGAQ